MHQSCGQFESPTAGADEDDRVVLQANISEILPFLYLGNERDAFDFDRLRSLGITDVLNVTAKFSQIDKDLKDLSSKLNIESHMQTRELNIGNNASLRYKWLPASDSYQQNLRQHFEEAFRFIGKHLFISCS